MMADNIKNEQNKIDEFAESRAKRDIRARVRKSKEKLSRIADYDALEEELRRRTEAKERARREHYSKKAERLGSDILVPYGHGGESGVITIYKAKTALKAHKAKTLRRESFIYRTYRLIKGLIAARKEIKRSQFLSNEKRRDKYYAVFADAWQPVTDGLSDAADALWTFLIAIGRDFADIFLYIVDLIIKFCYYAVSFVLYIWDIIWDFRIWLDEHKVVVFQYFSAAVAAIAIVLIGIASLSGFEYSYYGRTLGITRSKREVYHTIEALGDKLSEASGANISLDVERDIQFKKVFGFNLNIDSADDILNTLTYMRDIQVRAYAINVNGVQTAVLQSRAAADMVLDTVKKDYTGPAEGLEYIQTAFEQNISVEEVGVQLGEVWNPLSAVRYLKTGSAEALEEDEAAKPLVSLRALAMLTKTEDVKFGVKYIDNSSLYQDETELITEGIHGKTKVVSEITTLNGEIVLSREVSRERVSNPVDAVYYRGTKPLPERKGTGSFQYPLKAFTITSLFGSRNTGIIGASRRHEGVDFAAPYGTKIYAADGGTVSFSGWRPGYGYVIIIDHGGLYETRYAHCSHLNVALGEAVYKDQNIALVGSSGVSSGSHLHFEIRYKEEALNPLHYLP